LYLRSFLFPLKVYKVKLNFYKKTPRMQTFIDKIIYKIKKKLIKRALSTTIILMIRNTHRSLMMTKKTPSLQSLHQPLPKIPKIQHSHNIRDNSKQERDNTKQRERVFTRRVLDRVELNVEESVNLVSNEAREGNEEEGHESV
jgi:hypothetical protein